LFRTCFCLFCWDAVKSIYEAHEILLTSHSNGMAERSASHGLTKLRGRIDGCVQVARARVLLVEADQRASGVRRNFSGQRGIAFALKKYLATPALQ
jgi:hypothetical protein